MVMDGEVIYATPQLENVGKHGDKRFWQGFVCTDEGRVYTYSRTWMERKGVYLNRKTSELTLIEPKNVGRANATTAQQQAVLEIEAIAKKKRDLGFHEEGQEWEGHILPMHGLMLKNCWEHVIFPCALQPKYNGIRAATDGGPWWGRKGLELLPEITAHIELIPETLGGLVLDGELMLPNGYALAQTNSRTKKFYDRKHDPSTLDLTYYVFDIVDTDRTFAERLELRDQWLERYQNDTVIPVPTYNCKSKEDIERYFQIAIRKGFEGIMVRNWDGLYLPGGQGDSSDLLKLKPFEDAEWEIINCVDGRGKEAETIIYVCKTKDGREFSVHPEGSLADRKRLWYEFCVGTYDPVGKMLTVRYQELSEYGVPLFPVGVTVRED